MAVFKLTLLFSQTSAASTPNSPNHRIAGWSEGWYMTATSISDALSKLNQGAAQQGGGGGFFGPQGFLQLRAALLASGAAIVGGRLQQVDVPGPSQTFALNLPGDVTNKTDVPQMAALCRAVGLNSNAIRRFTLRGIPDSQVVEGEAQFVQGYNTTLQGFFASLSGFQFRSRRPAGAPNAIVNISSAGTVTLEGNNPFVANAMVVVRRSKDSTGNLRGGRFQVLSVGPQTNQFSLQGWPYGLTIGGKVYADFQVTYPAVDTANTNFVRIVTRKVGRPFGQYRGRRSRRR